ELLWLDVWHLPAKMSHLKDEELGKKDDDHRFPPARSQSLSLSKLPRPRRLILALIGLVLVYQFFKHMPTDLSPARERYDPRLRQQHPPPTPPNSEQPSAVPQLDISSESGTQRSEDKGELYDGKIKLYELAKSLPSDKHPENAPSDAVVFAGSNLRSITDMLPLACRMAREQRNHVHLVVFGKEEVSVEGIKQVNGIAESDCPIVWHDSRPDYAAQSTDARLARAVKGGLGFIQTFIAPDVIITQKKDWEDSFFWAGLERHLWEAPTPIPHIALPTTSSDIMWLATIDSTALRAWNDIHVDMVVHASQSASLARLIRSLDAADYLGAAPRLTIELPPRVDETEFLEHLNGLTQLKKDQIILRRRIQPHFMDAVEASIQTVESFYPLNPGVSHLLLLSPETELAPSFYHYLKYSILAYKKPTSTSTSKLIGISLDLPSADPSTNDGTPSLPSLGAELEFIPSFLWQAPNSNAALYFGDKWTEFHSFLSSRLDAPEFKATIPAQNKLISKKYPAFMEYLLEMMQAKGYYMLYPSLSSPGVPRLVNVHQDLSQSPEEFINEKKEGLPGGEDGDDIELVSLEKEPSQKSTIRTLFDTFPRGFPGLGSLPLLSFDGEKLTDEKLIQRAEDYFQQFRSRYGGCSSSHAASEHSAGDLFCLDE
ncbi:hypothetical protein N7454_002690, partial [Penicillium verhagenii]